MKSKYDLHLEEIEEAKKKLADLITATDNVKTIQNKKDADLLKYYKLIPLVVDHKDKTIEPTNLVENTYLYTERVLDVLNDLTQEIETLKEETYER